MSDLRISGVKEVDPSLRKATIDRCHLAIQALGYSHPHLLLIHIRMRNRYVITRDIPTFAITKDARLYVNPEFCATLKGPELQGVMAHEILHPTLDHFDRAVNLGMVSPQGKIVKGRETDLQLWGFAIDMAINNALREDKITLPECALYPPEDYTGPMVAEAIWEFLRQKVKEQQAQKKQEGEEGEEEEGQGQGQGEARATQGCQVYAPSDSSGDGKAQGAEAGKGENPADGQGEDGQDDTDWVQVGREAREQARMIGNGSRAIVRLWEPTQARIRWERVLRHGFSIANAKRGPGAPTYNKISRRMIRGVIRPGWILSDPKIAIVVDVSGSMAREWVDRIVAETLSMLRTFPGSRAYLVTHTDEITWQGWLKLGGDKSKITESVQFTGGTDARPAYSAISEMNQRFDALIHFTDCDIHRPWPKVPAKKLIVGAFGMGAEQPYCTPPPGSELIACVEG